MKNLGLLLLSILFTLLLNNSAQSKEVVFRGKTMGTTYTVKAYTSFFEDNLDLKKEILNRLNDINNSMSVFNKQSEVSRFNRLKTGSMAVSQEFYSVIKKARLIHKKSDGAFDVTVSPLIELWGFGRNKDKRVPGQNEINKTLLITGFDNVIIKNGNLMKRNPGITMNLGAIAKGYGVDLVAETLKKKGIKNFFVEIGGEVYASGSKPDGKRWIIGIANPDKGSHLKSYFEKIELKNKAVATSGDYRNFFEKKGKSYSHIIDPKTGYPVSNRVVSVSVISDDCTTADGLATAIMVLGVKKGLKLLKEFKSEGMIVVNDSGLKIYKTDGFIFIQ